MSIIDLNSVRGYLGRRNGIAPADEAQLTDLLALAEAKVEEALGFRIAQDTRTEYYPMQENVTREFSEEEVWVEGGKAYFMKGSGGNVLQLRSLPVRSITTVHVDYTGYFGQGDNAFAAATLLTAGTDYYLAIEQAGISKSGQLMRRGTQWPSNPGSIKVVYVSGFTAAELNGQYANFKSAILKTVAALWNRYQQLKAGQYGKEMTSESFGGGVSASYVIEESGQFCIPDSAYEDIADWVSFAGLEL